MSVFYVCCRSCEYLKLKIQAEEAEADLRAFHEFKARQKESLMNEKKKVNKQKASELCTKLCYI